MAIQYRCRSCNHLMAQFEEENMAISLQLQLLSPEERAERVVEDGEGNKTIFLLCEYCQEAMLQHPELSFLTNPLQ